MERGCRYQPNPIQKSEEERVAYALKEGEGRFGQGGREAEVAER